MVASLQRMIGPYLRMARMMVGRAVVNLVNDTLKMQELQVTVLADEVRADVERFQNYGFTSHPFPGSEGVVVAVGGNRDHGIIIAVDDRRYRLKNLTQGEVAIYTDEGDSIQLKRNNNIEVTCLGTVEVNSPSILLGNGASRAILDERVIAAYNAHKHPGDGVPDQQLSVGNHTTTITKAL